MSSFRVFKTLQRAEYFELMGLFFIQGAAMAAWFVPLGTVLDAHGMHHLKPLAFATAALAAFVSPLMFGAMADRHASPVKVLRGLSVATAIAMAIASAAIHFNLNPWLVLALIQLHAFCTAPSWSIASTIVFSRLKDAKKAFGPVRAMGTIGWMAGCWLVSALGADTSALAGFAGSVLWLLVAGFTYCLPELETPPAVANLTWHERLGLDALTLLRNPEHRVVFITTALYAIPIAAFYPYSPAHMQQLGLTHTSAWMSLGQITEIIGMFTVGAFLLKWRLKWIFALGLAAGVVRFGLSAVDSKYWLLAGVSLHGVSFVYFFITGQIYLEQRVEVAWRARAQALMTLMNNGVGNLIGYLGMGAWFTVCGRPEGANWTLFWSGVSLTVAVVLVFFWVAYPKASDGLLRPRHACE